MAKKILIVDDESDAAKLLALRLGKNGYETLVCNTGNDALACVKKDKPDLVILDIKLPDIDGYEVLKRLRADRSLWTLPIIFSTADASVSSQKTILQYDTDGCVIKPYDANELLKKIKMLLLD